MAAQMPARLPGHVAIIMDGNGRWAQARGKSRTRGHLEGVKTAKRIVRAACQAGIRYLTLYTFSTENWKRSPREVSYLMFLIKDHLRKEYDFYRENQIRVVHSGHLDRVPPSVAREIRRVVEDTAAYTGMTVNLSIDYGGRDEVVRAVNRALAAGKGAGITEEDIRLHLDHPEIPDPDLVIRTGQECRISNFLLWQLAYSELYFSSKMWPDWQEEDFLEALRSFGCRERRFGALRSGAKIRPKRAEKPKPGPGERKTSKAPRAAKTDTAAFRAL